MGHISAGWRFSFGFLWFGRSAGRLYVRPGIVEFLAAFLVVAVKVFGCRFSAVTIFRAATQTCHTLLLLFLSSFNSGDRRRHTSVVWSFGRFFSRCIGLALYS